VSAVDLKFYRSAKDAASLGGDISGTEIISGTANNLFSNVSRADQITGKDYYLCMYLKNTSAEEMKNVSFWESVGTPGAETTVRWGFEAHPDPYRYHPFGSFNGSSDFTDIADTAALDLQAFSISCWFKTSTNYSGAEGAMVNKGGFGSESAGENMNYGLWIHTDNKLRGGFEQDATGTDYFLTSPSTVNDGQWHHAAITYNASSVMRLYLDGVIVDSLGTAANPEVNAKPLRLGANSRATDRYFNGSLDEVRVWNMQLQTADILGLYNDGNVVEVDNIVYANKFGATNNSKIAQEIANINTPPLDIVWTGASSQPSSPNIGTLKANGYRPIWVWWQVGADAADRTNDRAIFNFTFQITTTGTGTGGQTGGGGGGGTGGNPPTPTPGGGGTPGTVDNFKVAIVGDWGEENETDDVVGMIKDGGYNWVIGTGDNSYTSSDSEWYQIVKSIDDNQGSSITFDSCVGNHDSGGSITSHFKYDHTYDSVDFQNIHLLILDTESDMGSGSSQFNFAKADLEAQQNRNNIDWIFVAFHRPAIGPDSDHVNNEEQQVNTYFDMFIENGVNLVCNGHNHIWFRSFPVKRSSGSSVTKVISDGGPYTVGEPNPWLIALISGTGGHDDPSHLYGIDDTPKSYTAYQNNSNNGILSAEVTNNGQTITCKFINTGGSVKHTWVMNKA